MSDYFTEIFPLDPDMPKWEWAKLRDALLSRGFMVADTRDPSKFVPGPGYGAFCTAVPHLGDDAEIEFSDYGDKIMVSAGENVSDPKVPGTDRVVDDWVEFIDRWVKNTDEKWVDPVSGKSFGLFNLDWENTLAAGKGMLSIMNAGYLDGAKLAAFATEVTGYKFSFALVHI